MAHKKDRKQAEQEDRVGRKIRRTAKKGIKKAKIWKDSKLASDEDLNTNAQY